MLRQGIALRFQLVQGQFNEVLGEVETAGRKLNSAEQQVKTLQTIINASIDEKKELKENLAKAEASIADGKKKLFGKDTSISNRDKVIESLKQKIKELEDKNENESLKQKIKELEEKNERLQSEIKTTGAYNVIFDATNSEKGDGERSEGQVTTTSAAGTNPDLSVMSAAGQLPKNVTPHAKPSGTSVDSSAMQTPDGVSTPGTKAMAADGGKAGCAKAGGSDDATADSNVGTGTKRKRDGRSKGKGKNA